MKANTTLKGRHVRRALYAALILGTTFLAMARSASAQLYVTQKVVQGDYWVGFVSEYDAKTGKVIAANFITGLELPANLLVSGDNLFVTSWGGATGSVGKYDAETGAAINQNLISGEVFYPIALALSGDDLFVSDEDTSTVGEYDAQTGATINASFINPGLDGGDYLGLGALGDRLFVTFPTENNGFAKYNAKTGKLIRSANLLGAYGIAFFGDKLLVGFPGSGTIGEYDAKTLKLINTNFIAGLSNPHQIALLGDKLFVTNEETGTVSEYDARTGAVINTSFISGLSYPWGVAVKATK
jgi:WD40 repeat protein